MKAEDLRLDNLILYNTGIHTVDTVILNLILDDIDKWRLIPLTEDWLINKADFKEVGQAIRKPLNQFLELCYIKPLKEMRLQTIDSGFTINLPHLQSIHNLQNFWKEHTGQELEII